MQLVLYNRHGMSSTGSKFQGRMVTFSMMQILSLALMTITFVLSPENLISCRRKEDNRFWKPGPDFAGFCPGCSAVFRSLPRAAIAQ
jgi:hypothetical protein